MGEQQQVSTRVNRNQILQGELQVVFDVLYDLGVIQPVLQLDWQPYLKEMEEGSVRLATAVRTVNRWNHDPVRMRVELARLDEHALQSLAIVVAKELADFHQNKEAVVH